LNLDSEERTMRVSSGKEFTYYSSSTSSYTVYVILSTHIIKMQIIIFIWKTQIRPYYFEQTMV